VLAIGAFHALLGHGAGARADAPPTADACLAAHEQGQEARLDGHFLAARDALQLCVAAACPVQVRADCGAWLAELAVRTPSMSLVVGDGAGGIPAGLAVYVDEQALPAARLAGAFELDPGPHALRIEAPGFATVTRSVVVQEGERGQLTRVTLTALPAAAASAGSDAHPPSPRARRAWIAGHVLVASAAAAGGVALVEHTRALRDHDQLERCRPDCGTAAVDRALGHVNASRITGGVSAALAGGALAAYLVALFWPERRVTAALVLGPRRQALTLSARF